MTSCYSGKANICLKKKNLVFNSEVSRAVCKRCFPVWSTFAHGILLCSGACSLTDWPKALCSLWDNTHGLQQFDPNYFLLELWFHTGRILLSWKVCEDSVAFLLSELLRVLTSGFGKKVLVLHEPWTITFPCSDYLSILGEINPTGPHKPSSAALLSLHWVLLSLQVEELRCTVSQLCPWKHAGFLWQSHWAPKPSCVPAFAVWLWL